MAGANGQAQPVIDKRDFDRNRQSASPHEPNAQERDDLLGSRPHSSLSMSNRFSDNNDGLLSDVVEEIVERDRRKIARKVVRIGSFVWGIVTCLGAGSITAFSLYGPLLLTRLHYTQLRVNEVSIAAGVSMYLPVSLAGYLCDRYSPSPLTLFAGITFGFGYLLAASVYKSGPPPDAGGSGYPFWVMVVAFVAIGMATCSMYLAAVTTCAKNFGRGKHKGIILAVPIAAFGLSGMWQSQVGTYLLCERLGDGSCGDVDVYKYFVFLAILLVTIGVIGTFALRIVDEEEETYIDEAVEELERSGLLAESEFFQPRSEVSATYGTFSENDENHQSDDNQSVTLSEERREAARREKEREEEERRKKNWLLNYETRTFLADHTMWWLALGFFLVTGPGEAYLNNLGTIVQTLNSDSTAFIDEHPAGLPSTHVTIIALTSTIARLLTGSLSDLFAPTTNHYHLTADQEAASTEQSTTKHHPTLSRIAFLIPSALLLSLGFLLLSSPFPTSHPELSHLTTALVGLGYGSAFSLVPIIISVVWGVENFGTNWGIVAMFPAAGAAMWGVIYSRGYQDAADRSPTDDGQCQGWRCFGFWSIGCTVSVWVAVAAWLVAWGSWRRRGVVV
ncbi:MFS transporter [Aspergillus puulaauensis]|uniref:Probable transporter MCH1 n=1 Tax=Aspergillus puulaauensis TaxID=1220207 RepID=A0A7R7XES3_9EURO|nr:putative monocarboxylate transporter Mch1 [Aspergillus puulaauensis]BCS19364.1 putative monocarboxylate transporter Mch1 [Aspergillus puulaauensis]